MIHEHRHLLDWLVWVCAGISAFGLSQAATVVAIGAGLASILLAGLRIYDRFTCGNWNGPGRR